MTRAFIHTIAFVTLSFPLLHGVLGDLICDELPLDKCAYSISESGKRCVRENYYVPRSGLVKYQCKTSEVVVDNMKNWIESDECINACGLDRITVGISSDYLLNRKFVAQLCSRPCFQSCPNIVDLYSNLALAEGMDLYGMCGLGSRRRSLLQPKSSSDAENAGAPVEGGASIAAAASSGAIFGVPIGSPVSSVADISSMNDDVAALGPSADFY